MSALKKFREFVTIKKRFGQIGLKKPPRIVRMLTELGPTAMDAQFGKQPGL